MENRLTVDFFLQQARDPLLEERPKFGPGDPGHLQDGSVQAWLGTRPVVYDLRQVLQKNHVEAPGVFHLLQNHDLLLVYYAFGIVQASNFREVVRARLEAQYEADPLVTIYQVFPNTELTQWGIVEGKFRAEFDLSTRPEPDSQNKTEVIARLPGAIPGGSAALQAGGKVALALSLQVATPLITAAGINNDYGLWEFRRHDVPLVGDHQVGHLLLVRRPVAQPVAAKLRLSVDVGSFSFLTSARFTDWVPVTLQP